MYTYLTNILAKVKKGEELFTSYGGVYWLGFFSDEEQVVMTPRIELKIRESANDLFVALKQTCLLYSTQSQELAEAFNKI